MGNGGFDKHDEALCPTCGTLCVMHPLSNGLSYTPVSATERRLEDMPTDAVIKAMCAKMGLDYGNKLDRKEAGDLWHIIKDAASRSHVATQQPYNHYMKFAIAVRGLVNGSPFDLTDSPKSLVSNLQRLVRELDEVVDAAPSSVGPYEPPMVYDPQQGKMVKPGGERLPDWMAAELKDGDRLCEAAGVQRTECGNLNVPKIINALREQGKASARPHELPIDAASGSPQADGRCTTCGRMWCVCQWRTGDA